MTLRGFAQLAVAAIAVLSCTKADPLQEGFDHAYDGMVRFVYDVDTVTVIANPERGFFTGGDIYADDPPFKVSFFQARAKSNQRLVYIGFYLTDFYHGDISEEYLQKVRDTFENLRSAGMKCVLRFAYTIDENAEEKDAPKEWVLRHIEQLAPVLKENSDVIFVLQAGFVGVWGEWGYTTNFEQNTREPEGLAGRGEVLRALLKALPADRQICVRTPFYKRWILGLEYADSLTVSTAHDGSDIARVAGHNDCFLASSDDYGTYITGLDRKYWQADTRYTAMCGEMCNLVQYYCSCKNTKKQIANYHWDALNMNHSSRYYSHWVADDSCGGWVENHLGYRFALEDAYLQKEAVAGQDYRIVLKIRNYGVSSTVNYRYPEILLVDADGNKTVYPFPKINLQKWYEDTQTVLDLTIKLPGAGKYTVGLNLPDPYESLHDNPYYSIRLANDNMWNEKSGYNSIASLTIQ